MINKKYKKKVFYHTKYNEYWKEELKLFTAADLIAELTQHIPPKCKHLIRYYGLYSSRIKGKAAKDNRYEKFGIEVNKQVILVLMTQVIMKKFWVKTLKKYGLNLSKKFKE